MQSNKKGRTRELILGGLPFLFDYRVSGFYLVDLRIINSVLSDICISGKSGFAIFSNKTEQAC